MFSAKSVACNSNNMWEVIPAICILKMGNCFNVSKDIEAVTECQYPCLFKILAAENKAGKRK
jgi:hypothetical protein